MKIFENRTMGRTVFLNTFAMTFVLGLGYGHLKKCSKRRSNPGVCQPSPFLSNHNKMRRTMKMIWTMIWFALLDFVVECLSLSGTPNFMVPKRRFWKADQTFGHAFSNYFSNERSPYRVLTYVKSALKMRAQMFDRHLGTINFNTALYDNAHLLLWRVSDSVELHGCLH